MKTIGLCFEKNGHYYRLWIDAEEISSISEAMNLLNIKYLEDYGFFEIDEPLKTENH